MKFLTRICRLILGAVLIFSGFLKLIDPVGTSLIIKEYFVAFHLGFLAPAAVVAAVALALTEFATGVSLLARLRIKVFAWVALVMMSLFTVITLYLALFNPIADCGCFGEAIHLTNWQTFFKNLILLPSAVIIFIWRNAISEFEHPLAEWAFLLVFALFGAALTVYVSSIGPLMEFSDLSEGDDLAASPDMSGDSYTTTFIYEKDGERASFSLDALPDSTWTYVDAVTEGLGGGSSDADFYVENVSGADITSDILSRGKLLVLSVNDPEAFFRKYNYADVASLRSRASAAGFDFMTISSKLYDNASDVDIEDDAGGADYLCTDPMACDTFPGLADRKLLLTLNRSNGGMVYMDDGRIIKKWAAHAAFSSALDLSLVSDSELALLESANRQHSFVLLFVLLLLLGYIIKLAIFKLLR